ncbi:MAG: amino acid adenylation domain-containing protein, partial [Longimicrobiaceae bacterium]
VLHGGGVLTYGELDERSAGLARVLRGRGVGPEAPVGVLLEHSPDAVVALLAVLRAGGCWLPLDPAVPPERIARLLHDSGAEAVVTRRRWAGLLAGTGASVVPVDATPDAADDAPLPRVHPESAAYLIYTSGSTGRPKGVVVPHGAAAAHFAAAARAYGLTPADRGLVFASLGFDVALEQLIPPLLVGASVLLRDPDPWSPAELAARVEAHGVTVADLPAAYWAQLVQEPAAAEAVKRRLRVVSVGGEAFPPGTARAWAELAGGPARLLNGYGPTEAVVTATLHELPAAAAEGAEVRVPIGRPVEGHAAYVLDGGGGSLPVGVPGELCLGGALARGYLGQPAATAERFVPDPFGGPGARMYRTGDRARWLASGALEFLGRIDQQVKVRGFRIEPGEIEAVLLAHPRVREAVVTVREDTPGERRLVAYAVPAAAGRGRPELWPSVGEYPVYDDLLYHAMVSDERRNAAYREALRGVVAGRTAVDVGTGSEVLLARMCVEAGASRVYAVEVQEDSFRRARERVRELGLEDRIAVLHGDAATLALPEAVDVCVSELIGSIGGSEGAAGILDHARRWLKPGGAMVPRRCETWIAAAALPDELHADPAFGELAAGYAGRVMDAVGHRGDLRLCVRNFPADALLSDAGLFEDLDFTRASGPPRTRTVELRIGRGGRLDGFLLWIRFFVGERLAVDSLEHDASWLPVFFPAFYPGVEVAAGESLRLECSATLSRDGIHPDYHLRGVLRRLDGREEPVAFDSLHRRPPAAPNALHRRLVSAEGVRARPAAEARPLASELREHLRERLPEYMVPGALVLLDALPLAPSGKTDRRALPAPERGGGAEGYAAPRTPAEELVAGIFGEVLGAARVGARDNFFELGGHSLLGTRVVARLRAALGVEMPLRALFEAQTVAALAARVEAERGGDGRAAPPPLVRAERSEPIPLAFAQERLWFLHAMEPDEVGYNMAGPVRLRGRLDAIVLERALGALVERHEPLRTTFRPVARGAVQVVHPAGPARLPVADLGRLDADARGREAARLAQDDAARPFDLARGPVLRAALARLADDEHVLLLCMHHVVSDGWSMDVLFRDLFTLYEAFARGAPSPLPPLPVTYADFAVWQRGWLAGDALRSQLEWWRERLRGASPVLELHTDRPRPAVVSGRGAALPLAVPAATARGLHALARREGATLYMVARAAADLLLARWSGQEDIVVGSPIANRTRVELDALVGMFVNTLALRTDLSGDPTFLELLGRVRETALDAYAHQDLPFERLVEEIAPERSLSHTPLFQAMFALQNTQGAAPPSLDGLRVEEFPLETRAALFDLELELWGADGGLAGGVRFRTDLFDDATIARFAAQYLAVLAAVCAAPDERLSAIPILPPEEAGQLLAFGDGPAPAGSAGPPVPVLLAAQAARTPGAAAVRWDGGSLTHAELDASADRLAHRLRARGVGAGTTVAVCVERGPQVLVALLAVWKAGGVYLPLDPTHPADRLAFLLRDSGAELVVTEAAVASSLPEFGGEIVALDSTPLPPAPSPARGEGENGGVEEASARSHSQLAYLIYTSGSTGEPKAVAVEHGQLAHTLRGAGEVLGLRAADVVAALASVAFDISLLELLAPLLAGAAVRVVPRELPRDPEALVDAAADVTVLHAVPALMRQVVDVVRGGRELPSMRLLLVGGDSVPPELLRDVRAVLPTAAARVLYGPTEGTIICATYGVPAEDSVAGHPLGRPLPGVRLAVRGPRGEICPVGVPGELWISGGGVARGYLGRPELTAERFVTADGERAYRTGDRARWRPDGVLEFLGRVDEQVKVRGFRIEPGEVEAALRAQPGVREAVVVAREDRPGERRLVAYVVPRPAAELPGDAGSAAEQVAGWEAVFDETYGEGAAATDPTLNLTGWNSSYTGEPIPREEMREWVEHTARRILALRPERVLEIGCGTGLLLFRVAPRVRAYHGTDFSGVALDFVRRHLGGLPQVALAEREADRLEEYAGAGFDTVVLNSVAQYFPGVDYLLRVLEGAVAAVRPGGRIFVGDVRSLPLLGAFHASVELARAAHDLPAERLRARVRRGIAEEQELLLDPALWEALRARIPRVGRVEVQAKRGGHDNEVSRFRYDVVLHLDAEPADAPEPAVREWDGEDAAGLRALAERTASALLVRGVADARVRAHVRALERIAAADGAATAGWVHALAAADADPALEPEAVFALAEALGRGVEARPGAPGTLDVLFHPVGVVAHFPAPVDEELPWEAYANDPRWGRRRRALVPALRQAVRARLPEYMLPSAFVVLENLPLSGNGKVDRAALPAPDTAGAGEGRHVAPRTPAEERMAAVWAEVLGTERLGVEDNFFELGGHSLLATQVASRVREAFRVELPLRAVFEAPTVAELARRVERLRWDAAPAAESPPLVPVSREESLPLSFAQQRLWFIDRLEPGSPAYNLPLPLRLRGPLDARVLARTLGEVVRRHEALRTVFDAAGPEPVQVVRPAAPVPLPAADLSGLAEDAREAEARRIVADDSRRPFDLRRGPLLYARLLRLAPEDHVLAVAMHHVVSDGWSVGVLFREMAALYGAFVRGAPSPLPELPVQYADFAVWQRAWLAGDALERQLAWWRERLAGAPAVLEIPTDRPRRPAPGSRAALVARTLPGEAADRVRALARREGATLYMVLLAALDVLLARWSGGDDVVVGTPIANRTRRETEGLIGFFVNTLALRADLSGDPTFREVLERLRESTLGAYQHQDLPFERLVEELGVERSLAHTPLFQVVFAVDDGGGTPRPLGPVRVEHYEAGGDAAKFDLAVAAVDRGAELEVAFTFRAELWDAGTLERVLDAYLLLLDAAAADPARRVAALPLVTEAERAHLLGEWSGAPPRLPDDRGVYELFAAQARRTPDAVAVADRGSVLTYAALADRAGALARRLRALGVGPDVRVGICAERGAPTVAAMLAVAAAGGAYVPLDPEYPAERLAFMLADAGVRVLLSDGAAGDRLAGFTGEVVALDTPHDGLEDADALSHSRTFVLSHSQLACVIYTSGSTGRPRGVAVTHRGIVRLVRGADFVRIGPDDRVAQASNPVFDAAAWEVWGPLLNGGRVVCIDRDTALDARGLAAALREEGVTALFLTTALFNQAVREVPDAFAGVRHVLFGGEAADPAAVRACLAGGPPRRLLHVYGPTENTTFSSWQGVERVAEDAATVPIGRAVAGSTVYVLDAEMEPVPVGWPGELCVGGHGLARGYLGRPDSTAAAFVPHPFSGEAGARLYRTGDRVRWSAAGEIEFLGRADRQAKIRGFRIEPGEVEAALLSHPEVREAAVLVREDAPGERRLAAYVVARGDAPPGAEAMRAHLRRTLPDYMVPAAFVVLDRLPLTATGKTDRRALPAPEPAGGAREHDAPRTPTEALLAALCAGVLGVERVGARDDFFALGGHSLLATRVVARVRDTFGVDLPLRALFEAPTVAGLAERVDALLGSGAARHAPPLVRAPRIPGRPLPLSFAQQRLWLVEQVDPGTAAYTLPVPLRLRGALDAAALGRALDEIVRRHEALRTTFTAAAGEPGQVVHPAARGVLAIVELSGLAPAAAHAEARRLADAAMLRPFGLERGPLFRAVLARIAPDDAALLLAMHHAVADGWSLGVLLRELSALYGAFSRGEPSPLPELPFQYADFAAWQRGWLVGEVLERQVAWWREHLAGAPPLLELPTDRPRSSVRGARGGARAFRLPAAVALSLRELSAREGATLFMTVLAAWQALLARWSGQDDVLVGSPIAGRTHLELEGLIGFFVNTLPLRTELSGDPAFAALLRRVRESTLGAYAHQDVPFERLVEELGVERSLTHTPLFQAVLSLQNLGPLEHPLGDVRTEPLETEALTARFDLTLALAEEGEEIAGGATFRADLWDGATVERMLDGLGRVLEQAAADPSRPLSSLELLGSAERARLLEAWNDTAAELPFGPVHERIAAQAARTPDAAAVVFGDETVTFAGLMARAGSLSRRLRESGVGPDARVGLLLERGPGLVVGVLGILQAGGAYLPLDPSHPDERLLFMLRDAGAA